MIREKPAKTAPGMFMLVVGLIGLGITALVFLQAPALGPGGVVAAVVILIASILVLIGLFLVNPNEYKVLQLFGEYVGTVSSAGLKWANPFYTKRKISVRVRNFETGRLKVNDANGNPIEIGCVVVWKVTDTAEALFSVNDFVDFVHVQSEAALRNMATGYPYDAHESGQKSLSGDIAEISMKLRSEIKERLEQAGVDVLEARISHLAYASEIAAAMLQRQQASAVVAARQQIVEGAVGMVETALEGLAEKGVVALDEDRKAVMVSNLLVVLCSDRHTQPVVNTGTLHQ